MTYNTFTTLAIFYKNCTTISGPRPRPERGLARDVSAQGDGGDPAHHAAVRGHARRARVHRGRRPLQRARACAVREHLLPSHQLSPAFRQTGSGIHYSISIESLNRGVVQ